MSSESLRLCGGGFGAACAIRHRAGGAHTDIRGPGQTRDGDGCASARTGRRSDRAVSVGEVLSASFNIYLVSSIAGNGPRHFRALSDSPSCCAATDGYRRRRAGPRAGPRAVPHRWNLYRRRNAYTCQITTYTASTGGCSTVTTHDRYNALGETHRVHPTSPRRLPC